MTRFIMLSAKKYLVFSDFGTDSHLETAGFGDRERNGI